MSAGWRTVHARPGGRRVLGRALQAVAAIGAVVALSLAVVGWRVVGAFDAVAVQSTGVTAEALTSLGDTLDVAADLVLSVDETLTALEQTLATTTESLTAGRGALGSVATLAADAAPALSSATATLETLEGIGETVDSTLAGLSRLPFGPEYDPEAGFGATIRSLAEDLDPLAASFATTADDLEEVVETTDALEADLRALTTAVGDGVVQIDASATLIEDYRATADRARLVAADAAQGLGGELLALRVLLLVGGLVFAVGQMVPWLVARTLLEDPRPDTPIRD